MSTRNVVQSILFLLALSFLNDRYVQAQPFHLYGASDLVRVFQDGFNLGPTSDTLHLFGIRGEILSGQVVIHAKKELSGISARAGNLEDLKGTGIIEGKKINCAFVGSVPLNENAGNQPEEALVRTAPATYPDYLMPENEIDLQRGEYRGVWLTLPVPGSAAPGDYLGEIVVSSAQGEKAIPVNLTIYPFTMPEERHLKVTEWFTTRYFEQFHGIREKYSEEWFGMLGKYAENMAEHRQNVFRVPMSAIEITKSETGELAFDYSRFDQMAQVFWDTEKMDYLETGELAGFGEEGWYDTEIVLKDIHVTMAETGEVEAMPGEQVIPHLLPDFESHLRRKGWLDKTLFHVKDEPTTRNSVSWREMSAYMHRLAPDLVRIDAIETTNLFGEIEIAVPKLDYLESNYDFYKQGQEEGAELWIYTVGIYQSGRFPNKTIDVPLIGNRVLHWLNYRHGLTGFLHWGWNHWHTDDPYTDPGLHKGDGWHVYPARDGVINSLRWEQMRNGIQDYEYFWLLEQKIRHLRDSLGSKFEWIDPAQRGREIAGRVIPGLRAYSRDPEVLYAAKKEVIRELLDFESEPRAYIQTRPAETTPVNVSGWVGEIYGWTEPGTTIEIAGEEVPVSERGLFMRNIRVSREEDHVTVIATSEKGTRELTRYFTVQ